MKRTNQSVTPEERQARREHERKVYEARKVAGMCTRCGKHPALDGKQLCAEHDEYDRNRTQGAVKALRGARRRRRQCARCGRKSKTYTCQLCLAKQGRLARSAMPSHTNQSVTPLTKVRVEVDGYERERSIGRGKKGHPTKSVEDAQDIAMIRHSIEQAAAGLAMAGDEDVERTAIERKALRMAACGQLDHASRAIAEVLERHGYER